METIKCENCGCIMGATSEKCPVCGALVNDNEEIINEELPLHNYREEIPNPQHHIENASFAEMDKEVADNYDVETQSIVSTDKEDDISPIKKYAIAAALLIVIVCCGCWWYQHSQQQAIAVSQSGDNLLQQKQEQRQIIINEDSYAEEATDTLGKTVNETENVIVNTESTNDNNLKNNAIETVKPKIQGPEWIQGTWLYSFPDEKKPETGDCTYCKVIIDGNYLTIVEKTHGNNEAYEYHGKWKYKDEGEGFFIYYNYYGGKGIDIDFDKELLILPRYKYINGNRVYEYLHKVSD